MTAHTHNKPIDTFRDGALKATIWRNAAQDGGVRYTVDLARTYKGSDGQLRDTHSFSGAELLRIALLATQAYWEIVRLKGADRIAQEPTTDGQAA